MSSPLLRVEGLSKAYGHDRIFEDVSFSLCCGETLGIFGSSGSGKSTLGRCSIRLENASSGSVYLSGEEILLMSRRKFNALRPQLQMIFQHPEVSLNPRKTLCASITEALVYHKKISPGAALQEMSSLLNHLGLSREHLARYPHQLSGGEVQRAVLARIFSIRPRVVVADEPTSMLDVSVQALVLRLMKDLQNTTSVAYIFISHDPDVLMAMCDRIAVLEQGKMVTVERGEFGSMMRDQGSYAV